MADFKENSPIAELEDFRMPPRDPSLDDFEKLENFIIQDKNPEAAIDSRNLQDDNDLLLGFNKPEHHNKDYEKPKMTDTENNRQNLLGDFNNGGKADLPSSNDAPPSYEQSSADLLGDTFSDSHLPRYTQEAYEKSTRPSERLLEFNEAGLLGDEISNNSGKLVHPPSDSGYVPSPAEENIAEIKEEKPEAAAPSGLKITPFVDSVDNLLSSEKLDTIVEKDREEPKKSPSTYENNPKTNAMSTEVSSSKPATSAGCPWSPSKSRI